MCIGILAASALAERKNDGYVYDKFGNLVHDSFKRCVRTGTWAPEKALEECGDKPPVAIINEKQPAAEVLQSKVQEQEHELAPVTPLSPKTVRVHFEFDKDQLSDADKKNLDQYIDYLKTSTSAVIKVEGWADNIGTDHYNMNLSTRRANVVTRYLIVHGIRVRDSRGMGESRTQDCPGKVTPEVKKCLAEDRYDEIVADE